MPSHRLTLTLSLFVTAGCATAAPMKSQSGGSGDFDRTMVEVRAQNAGFLRQIDELQNKIFVLEDALESRRLADEQRSKAPPRLVSKRIGVPAAEAPAPQEYVAPSFVAEDSTVEYAGEAALPVRRERVRAYARPLLLLSGSGNAATVSVVSSRDGDAGSPERAGSGALRLYHRSLDELNTGHISKAVVGFRKFLTSYPQHKYADNAQYWVGECYWNLKQFRTSAREFRRVIERYPHGNKVPEAMLKLGLSQLATGEGRDGRRVLESLRRTYPKQPAARAAADRLAQADDTSVPATVSLDLPRR